MNLKQLEYFVTVANEGNITAAARKLHMSQPPLSMQLKLLEEDLNCVLLERGGRKIKLTDGGKILYDYACNILNLGRIAEEEVRDSADKTKGIIRIGIVSSLVCSLALHWIKEFSKTCPNIQYDIVEGNTYELLNKLDEHAIHLAIIRTPYIQDEYEKVSLCQDSLVAIGDKEIFQWCNEDVTLENLSKMPLIIYRRWEEIIRKMFRENELNINCKVVCDDARTTVKFSEFNMGVGIVPDSAVELITSEKIEVKKIKDCSLKLDIELVYRKNSYRPNCAEQFILYMSNAFK